MVTNVVYFSINFAKLIKICYQFRFLKFQVQNDGFTWTICKEKFIHDFHNSFAKQLYSVTEGKKPAEKIEEYCKAKMEIVKKLFLSLPQSERNLLVMSGLGEISIKRLIAQKDADEKTFFILCAALDEIESSTPSQS